MAIKAKQSVLYSLLVAGILSTSALSAQDLKSATRLTDNEQYGKAKLMYEDLLKRDASNGDIYYYYGESYLKSYFSDSANVDLKEVTDQAKILFKKGINIDSLNPMNFVGLGKIALYSGDPITAKNYFTKAESLLPTKKSKIKMPIERQLAVFQKIAESYLKGPNGDTANIFPYLRKAEKLDKKNPETYLIKGDAYLFLMNDGSNAIFNYKKAQDLDASSVKAKLRLGQLWVRAKRPMDALGYYQEAVTLDSTFAPAYRELAELYNMAAQYDNAQKNYKKFLDLNKDNLAAKVRYASFLFLSKNYNETIKQAQEVMALDSSFTFLYRLMGYSSFETGQYEQGLKYMNDFFANTKPGKILPSDYSYNGKLYSKLNQDSLAIIEYEKCFAMDKTNDDVLSDEIASFNKMKKYAEAAKVMERRIIVIGNPSYADYVNLGKVYYQAQDWNKADTSFIKVSELKPDYVPAYLWRARVYANKDPETKEGLAKPFYELVIQKASADSLKYSKELLESYKYEAYYFFKNKKWRESMDYWIKVEGIDPNDEQAKSAIKDLKARVPKQ